MVFAPFLVATTLKDFFITLVSNCNRDAFELVLDVISEKEREVSER